MRQTDVYEKAVRQLTSGMNLVDIKVYADEDGEVEAVLLKYLSLIHISEPTRPY